MDGSQYVDFYLPLSETCKQLNKQIWYLTWSSTSATPQYGKVRIELMDRQERHSEQNLSNLIEFGNKA